MWFGAAVPASLVAATAGFFQRADWSEPVALAGVSASGARGRGWWNPVGAVSIPVRLADLGARLVLLLPLVERIAHAG